MEIKWLEWAQKLQAIAQNSPTYSQGGYWLLEDVEKGFSFIIKI